VIKYEKVSLSLRDSMHLTSLNPMVQMENDKRLSYRRETALQGAL